MRTYIEDHIITDRSGIVENRYNVHAAVVDKDGNILYAVGDPYRITLARSAAKPAQALAILETGCADTCEFNNADIALMCASHSSEPRHIDQARSMLVKAGAKEDMLRCGGHAPLSEEVNRSWIKNDFEPTGICNNCSGKHAGMLAGSNALGASFDNYHHPRHPMQLQVKRVFEDLAGPDLNDVRWGIDGCNLPAPACSLHVLAKIYAFFAACTDEPYADSQKTAGRIFKAMSEYPELVGGQNRFCTELMQAFDGSLIGKLGADGCYGIGIRASEQTARLGAQGAVGIAVKIEDGNINILYSAVAEILEQLEIGTPEIRGRLAHFHHQKILNTMKVVTGRVSHQFKVRKIQTSGP